MNWLPLQEASQLDEIKQISFEKPVVIFKHSTRCSISSMAKDRLDREKDWNEYPTNFYYLDLLQYRPISNQLAEDFQVHHESPQILLLHQGECVYDQSHNGITVDELKEQIQQVSAS